MYMLLARNSQQAGETENARKWLEVGIVAQPEAADLRWMLAEYLLQAADFDGSGQADRRAQHSRVPPARAGLLDRLHRLPRDEARLVGREKWAEAAAALERVQPLLAARADSAALASRAQLMLAECYERLGDVTKQHAAFSRAVALDQPDDPAESVARLGLARSLEAMGKTAEALDEYRRLAAKNPSLKPVVAGLMIRRNLELPPTQRRWPEVEQYIDQIARETPDSPEPLALRAKVLINRIPPQVDRARGELEKARDLQPDQVERWLPLIRLAELEGKPEAAKTLLGQAERQLGDRVELRLARAGIVAARGGDEAPKALSELAKNLEKFPEADRQRLQRGLAEAYSHIGDRKEARQILDRLIEQAPNNLDAQLLSFDLATLDADTATMERRIQGIEKADKKDGILGKYSRVCLLVQKARGGKAEDLAALKEARRLLAGVTSVRPNWARGALAGAEIDDLAKAPDAAITGYLQAIDLGERNPAVFRRTVALLTARGRFPEADLLMQKLLQWEQGTVAEDLLRASGTSLRVGDLGRALDLARRSAQAGPDDYRNHLWLGQVLAALAQRSSDEAQRAEAGKAFRRATELGGEVPETWLGLIQYLTSTGKKADAEAAVRDERRHLPADLAPLALAQSYELLGERDKAAEHYDAALKIKPDDLPTLSRATDFDLAGGRVKEAESRLRRVVESAGPRSSETATSAWARRTLAVLMAAEGDPQRSLKALEILGGPGGQASGLAEGEIPIEDLRARAQVLAMQPGRESRRRAIATMERILDRGAPRGEDLFLLAKLYQADGDWPKARERMRTLLAQEGKNPTYLAYFILALLRRGDPDEARIWLARVEEIDPKSPQTVELRARLLKAQGKEAEAAALLNALAKDDPAMMESVARLLEQIGLPDSAEPIYAQLVDLTKRPEAVLAFAEYLGRRGRTREAIDLCDGAWKTLPPEAVAKTSVGVLQAAKGSVGETPDIRRVDSRLGEALRKAPEDPKLLIPLAVLRGLQDRHDDAEAIYRGILRRDPKNVLALNNLAWLLALKFGKSAEAETMIDQAITIVGPLPAFLDTRAVIRLSLKRGAEAVEDLVEATGRNPTATGYFHLAQAYRLTKDLTAAAGALDKAKKEMGLQVEDLDPLEREAYERLVVELAKK